MARRPTEQTPDDPVTLEPPGEPRAGLAAEPPAEPTVRPYAGSSAGYSAEPSAARESYGPRKTAWLRGLWMLVFAALFGVAQSLLVIAALVQFLWLLIARERNLQIAAFGEDLARWLRDTARFLTGASEDKPFPFRPLGG